MDTFKKIATNIWFASISGVFLISIVIVNIINFFGGIKIKSANIFDSAHKVENLEIKSEDIYLKIGFSKKYIFKNVKIKFNNYDITSDEIMFKESFIKRDKLDITSFNGTLTVLANNKESVSLIVSNLEKIFISNLKNKRDINLTLNNFSFKINKLDSQSNFELQNFNGVVLFNNEDTQINGEFNFADDKYFITNNYSDLNDDFSLKIEGKNIIFKSFIENQKGKVSFSVNNITKFLNIITPDTINFDLKNFDGSKNSLYFVSDLFYNDVRRDVEFKNSKLQIFGGSEENIKIENINNNQYKISADIKQIQLTQDDNFENLKVIKSQFPKLQFGSIFPDFGLIFDINIKNINLPSNAKQSIISDLQLNGEIGYGAMNFDLITQIKQDLTLKIKGFMYNYETQFRKGLIQFDIKGKYPDKNLFNLFNFIEYQNSEDNYIQTYFDFLIIGDDGIINNISFKDKNANIRSGKFEFNFYSKDKSYFLDLDIEKLNLDDIKISIPSIFKKDKTDLFRILFDYLKLKNLSTISINCESCSFNKNEYNMLFGASIAKGKLEVTKFKILNSDFDFNTNFIADIRNLKSNLINLNINVYKWNNFSLDNIMKIDDLFLSSDEFKLPSFENFSGTFNINLKNIKGKVNTLDLLNLQTRIVYGDIKESLSLIKFNGIEKKDFFNLNSKLNTSKPIINFNAFIPNVNLQSILKPLLNNEKFDLIEGFADFSLAAKTKGFFVTDLINNLDVEVLSQSNKINVKNFNLEALASFLSNPKSIFKNITNQEIIDKVKKDQDFQFTSKFNFNQMTFNFENLTLKSLSSNSIFVGKIKLFPENKFLLQIVGKSAIAGSNVNNKLIGVMPLYIASAISNTENDDIKIQFDYSQINKYSEARRVIFE